MHFDFRRLVQTRGIRPKPRWRYFAIVATLRACTAAVRGQSTASESNPSPESQQKLQERVTELESEVSELKTIVQQLQTSLNILKTLLFCTFHGRRDCHAICWIGKPLVSFLLSTELNLADSQSRVPHRTDGCVSVAKEKRGELRGVALSAFFPSLRYWGVDKG